MARKTCSDCEYFNSKLKYCEAEDWEVNEWDEACPLFDDFGTDSGATELVELITPVLEVYHV